MSRTAATLLVLFAVSAASPAWVKEMSSRPKAQAAPFGTVAMVLAHAGVARKTMALRDLLDEATTVLEPAQVYAGDRAAMRACHAERYSTARRNVLTERATPLRNC